MKDSIKRRVLVFFAKFFGKAMFASLRLYGITAMIISDPFNRGNLDGVSSTGVVSKRGN